MPTPVDDISEIARRFAGEYLIDFKVNAAARRAGCSVSDANAYLADPRVVSLINDGKRRASDRVNISVDWVLEKLRRIADGSPIDYFKITEHGRLQLADLKNLTDEQRDALKSIKYTANGPAIETHDKVGAVKAIGQFLDMFTEKVEHSGTIKTAKTALTAEEIIAELEARGLPTTMFDEAPAGDQV